MGIHEQIFRLVTLVIAGLVVGSAIGFVHQRIEENQESGFLHDVQLVEDANQLNASSEPQFSLENQGVRGSENVPPSAYEILSERSK